MRPGAFGFGHALHAMDAGFEFEPLEHVAAGDRDDRLLEAAEPGLRQLHHLEAPAVQRGVALVHAEELGGEERRLLAAGAGAHFEDGVALVGLVLGQQHEPHLALELGEPLVERGQFASGERTHLGIGLAGERRQVVALGARGLEGRDLLDERREVAVFLRQLGEVAAQPRRVGERGGELGMAPHQFVEPALQRAFAHPSSSSSARRNSRRSSAAIAAASCSPRRQLAQRLGRRVQQAVHQEPRRRLGVEPALRHHRLAHGLEMTPQRDHRRHRAPGRAPGGELRELDFDDAPRLGRGFGPGRAPGHRGALEIGEIIEEHAIERVDGRIGVGRDRRVDDEDGTERPFAQRRRDERRGEDGAAGAERCHDHVGGDQRRLDFVERRMVAGKPRSGAFGALGRAAHDEPSQPGAEELLGHQLAHLGGADQQRGAAVEVAVNAARQIERGGGDRLRPLGDAGLAPDSARAGEGGEERALKIRADETQLRRGAMRAPHLGQHVRLADDAALKRARDREEMAQGGIALVAVERGGDALGRDRHARGDQRRKRLRGTLVVANQLDAVAGRDQHRFARAERAQLLERAVDIAPDQREALAQRGRARAMIDADDEETGR